MVKKYTKDLSHYIPLVGVLAAGLIGFILFSYDTGFQLILLIAVAISYVIWGIIHHLMHDDLDILVVVEYVAVATLGLVIVFSLLFRA